MRAARIIRYPIDIISVLVVLSTLSLQLRAEPRASAVKLVYCPGVLVGAGWMIIIPYHLFKTRGVRALIPLGALIGSFLAAHILAGLVYMIVST